MLSIEGQPYPEQGQLAAPAGPETQTRNQGRQGYQGKNWNKNHNQKQRRPYCVFHGESAGHSTKDCPETKETQERMKNKQTAQPPAQQSAREVNNTYTTGHQQYCPMYPALNVNQIHPSTLASAYYPNFLPAWRSAPSQQPPAGNYRSEASLTYINPKPPHITYLKTNQPPQNQSRFEHPPQQQHMQQLPPPPPHNQPPTPKK